MKYTLLGDVKHGMDASEKRVLEQNMAKLKQVHEEQVFAEFQNMD
jgi:hypothetical protein